MTMISDAAAVAAKSIRKARPAHMHHPAASLGEREGARRIVALRRGRIVHESDDGQVIHDAFPFGGEPGRQQHARIIHEVREHQSAFRPGQPASRSVDGAAHGEPRRGVREPEDHRGVGRRRSRQCRRQRRA